MKDCLFCRIASHELPSRPVHEDAGIYAFEDIAPKAPTHVLLIPKKHIARLSDVGAPDAPLLGELLLCAAGIAREKGLAHYRLALNNGEGAGQSVFHVHFHLLGGRAFAWPPG
ncbi:MAG TPA: histidine triad nucleotide-binding protein [Thermoanaerobaculia bacterium]|nr:histidine triad nucleotide-binding protein [Thermoanaerobaculia bacterium]